jgi:hypothetical protein
MMFCVIITEIFDVAGVGESVSAHGQTDTFLLFLVWYVVADYFAVSDLSVLQDVGEFGEKTCVGAGDVIEKTRQPSIIGQANRARFFRNYIQKKHKPVCLANFAV